MGLTKRVHAKRHPKMELPLQKCAWNQGSNMPNQPHADSPEPDGIFDLVAAWKAWALLIRKEQCILQPTSNLLSTKQATFNAGLVHGMARPHLTIYTRGLCPKNAPRYLHFFGLANQISVHGPCCFWGSCRGHCWPSLRRIDWNTTPPPFFEACKAPIWCNTPSSSLHSELAGDYIDQTTNLQSSFTPTNVERFTKLSPAFDSLQETHLQSKTSNAIGSCT